MNKLILLFATILIIFSCKKDEPDPGCLEQPLDIIGNTTCQNLTLPDVVCEAQDIGTYQLDDLSKSYIPSFCEESLNIVSFVNLDGEVQRFNILTKTFIKTGSITNSGIPCANDSSKVIAYCIQNEEINLRMSSGDGHDFTIVVKTNPQFENQTGDKVGDFLQISARLPTGELVIPFLAVVNQRTLDYTETPSQRFDATRQVGDNIYENVISNDPAITPSDYRFFYTQTEGLIGFRDLEGELWTLP